MVLITDLEGELLSILIEMIPNVANAAKTCFRVVTATKGESAGQRTKGDSEHGCRRGGHSDTVVLNE